MPLEGFEGSRCAYFGCVTTHYSSLPSLEKSHPELFLLNTVPGMSRRNGTASSITGALEHSVFFLCSLKMVQPDERAGGRTPTYRQHGTARQEYDDVM